jgi:hypothetical protein
VLASWLRRKRCCHRCEGRKSQVPCYRNHVLRNCLVSHKEKYLRSPDLMNIPFQKPVYPRPGLRPWYRCPQPRKLSVAYAGK